MKALSELLVDHYGFRKELVRTLVLKYPAILNMSKGQLRTFFNFMKQSKGIDENAAIKMVFNVPPLLNVDIGVKAKELEELFQIYHKISAAEVTEIWRNFPFLYCCPTRKIQLFLAEFRKYRLTKEQIINLCSNSGGILGCKVSNYIGLFDFLRKQYGIKASFLV